MAGPGHKLASLISALFVLRLVTYFEVMACVVFIWDYILTFEMEVDYIWKSKWNFMKGLYLFQRYLPFIDIMWLFFIRQMGVILTKTGCRRVEYANGAFMIVGLAASEMILTIRTWAVWDRNQWLSIILPILYSVCWVADLFIMVRLINSTTFGAPPYPGYRGCFVTNGNQDMAFIWALLIIWDGLLLMLMSVPAIQSYRDWGNASLMTVVYRDGVVYYLYLFALSCINLIVVKALPREYALLLTLMERLVHATLTSRVILHIRAQEGDNFVWSDELTNLGTVHFHDSDTNCTSSTTTNISPA